MRGLHILINFQAILLNPSPKKPLFLRCFPYIVNATPRKATGHGKGEGEYYKKQERRPFKIFALDVFYQTVFIYHGLCFLLKSGNRSCQFFL